MQDVVQIVESILKSTFAIIDSVYSYHREGCIMSDCHTGSRLIFPCYSTKFNNGKTRVSEQELRFLFVEQLNLYCEKTNWNIFYSIETPTEYRYRFANKTPHIDTDGQSAMVDLSIHDSSGRRICLIEFKAHNPEQFSYTKDLIKLQSENDSDCAKFFVQLIENESCGSQKNTIHNIEDKIQFTIKPNIHYYCHTLKGKTRSNSTETPNKLKIISL